MSRLRLTPFLLLFVLGSLRSVAQPPSPCDSLDASFSYVVTGNHVQFEINDPMPGAWYYWGFGDGDSGTGLDPDHTYSGPGTYYVCSSAWWVIPGSSDTCHVYSCEYITIGGGVSVEEVQDADALTAWPNPVVDHLMVAGIQGKNALMDLVDASGRSILSRSVAYVRPVVLDCSRMAPGIYCLRILDGSGTHVLRIARH